MLKGVELSHKFQFVTPAVCSRTNLVPGGLEQTELMVMLTLMLTAVGTGVQERPELREREITN